MRLLFNFTVGAWPRIRVLSRATQSVIFLLTGILVVSSSSPTRADTFTLRKGERYALCREYEENLNSFPDLPASTNVWPLNPKLADFRKPRWVPVELNQNLSIIRTMYLWNLDPQHGLDSSAAERAWKEKENVLRRQIAGGSVRLDRARIDFDGNGRVGTVYRFYHPLYEGAPENRYGYWYLFFDNGADKPLAAFRRYSGELKLYDSFLFRGRFYLVRWDVLGLNVLEPRSIPEEHELALVPVCILQPSKQG